MVAKIIIIEIIKMLMITIMVIIVIMIVIYKILWKRCKVGNKEIQCDMCK